MPSYKKYNLNFTKRVDHQAGHFNPERSGEPGLCEDCQAVYRHGRWTLDRKVLRTMRLEGIQPLRTICPACRQIKNGEPAGFVYLEGNFFVQHQEEIKRLLQHETKKAGRTNPLARIMEWKDGQKRLTVTTTTEHLAQQLGRSLKRAYDGEVHYDFSHENKLARVYWHRD